jgi:hypothetical protein
MVLDLYHRTVPTLPTENALQRDIATEQVLYKLTPVSSSATTPAPVPTPTTTRFCALE